MSTLLLTALVLFSMIYWIILISVLLSWVGIKINFIDSILEPIYEYIEKYIPTKIGPISFTPIILIMSLTFLEFLIYALDPTIKQQYLQLINF